MGKAFLGKQAQLLKKNMLLLLDPLTIYLSVPLSILLLSLCVPLRPWLSFPCLCALSSL